MKKIIVCLIFLTSVITFSFTTQDKPNKIVKLEDFEKHIDTLGIQFKMPKGYEEILTKDNKDLYYIFALKNKTEDFEVRYSVQPISKEALKKHQECESNPECYGMSPNNYYKSLAMANMMNMTGGKNSSYGKFPKEAVHREFNADAGLTQFFEFDCQFGKGYKYGQMVVLHKNNIADVIITYLSNDKDKHPNLMHESFYSLTFK